MGERKELEDLRALLVDLQSRLAFQEDTINMLDAIVTRQQRQLENLQELWQGQKAQLERVVGGMEKEMTEEKPPHY